MLAMDTVFSMNARSVNGMTRGNAQSVEPTVIVVDDDASLLAALSSLFRSVGLRVELFGSAAEFLRAKLPEGPRCLVLDIRLPGVSGLEFQGQLARSEQPIPVIIITGHGDIPMSVQAMKAGAVDFLAKPFRDQEMLDAVAGAVERDREGRLQREGLAGLKTRLDTLSPREREIMALATAGLLNKEIAGKLNLSEITVKIHRGKMMRKMDARSFASLVKMAEALGVKAAPGTGR